MTIRLTQDEHHAIVEMQDTGIEISASDQTRIFDRFYRVSSDRSRQTAGSGLGLAIVQTIAQAHRGTLQVQSKLGKGSIFTLHLTLGETAR